MRRKAYFDAQCVVDGQAVVRTEKHPVGMNLYEDVDQGASFHGPVAPCYFGPPQDLSLIVTLMEYDEGDPNAFRDEIHGAATGLAAAGIGTGGIGAIAVPLAAELANALIDTGDNACVCRRHS